MGADGDRFVTAPAPRDSLRARLEAVATPERVKGEACHLKLTDRRVTGTVVKPWERVAVAYVRERGLPGLDQLARWFNASLEETWVGTYCLSAVDPDGAAAFVQRHRAQFTKAMLAKARLNDHGRRTA